MRSRRERNEVEKKTKQKKKNNNDDDNKMKKEARKIVVVLSSSSSSSSSDSDKRNNDEDEEAKSSNNSNQTKTVEEDEEEENEHEEEEEEVEVAAEEIMNRKKKNSPSKSDKVGSCRFPMHRIKRIIRSDGDFRITQEAIFVINKASEQFLELFTEDAYARAVQDRKKAVGYNHLSSVVSRRKRYDFLSDFVPEKIRAEDALADLKLAQT